MTSLFIALLVEKCTAKVIGIDDIVFKNEHTHLPLFEA